MTYSELMKRKHALEQDIAILEDRIASAKRDAIKRWGTDTLEGLSKLCTKKEKELEETLQIVEKELSDYEGKLDDIEKNFPEM